jgi:hypothetical protein
VGEILGLGMSHGLGLGPPNERSGSFRYLERPDVPADWKDVNNWPEPMRKELGNDEGKTYNIQHRQNFGVQMRKLRETLDKFNPDFVIIWGDDQYENFKEEIIPAFCIQAYDDMEIQPYVRQGDRLDPESMAQAAKAPPVANNTKGEPADKVYKIRGHQEAGKYIARQLINEKIDIAYAYKPLHHPTFAHAFLNSMMFLDWDGDKGYDYPTITFQVNCYGARVIINKGLSYPVGSIGMKEDELDPDGPTPERCMEVGAAVARIVKRSPWRAAFIASSSWSHAFLVPKHYFIYPDVEGDHMMYDALVKGDYDKWRNVTNTEVLDRGWQELRNWFTMLGAMEELGHKAPSYSTFIESYSHNSDKIFATWDPR